MNERLRPINASLSGPDGAGKDTAVVGTLNLLFDSFGSRLKVARLDRPPMCIWQDEENNIVTRKLYAPLFRFIDAVHRIGDRDGSIRLVEAANAANVLMQGWVVRRVIGTTFKPDLYFSGRNYLTDPVAYAQFYAPELLNLNLEKRLRFMQTISGLSRYDQIYLMKITPELAYQRILKRAEEERRKPTGQPTWSHRHESIEGLTKLVKTFEEIPSAVSKVCPNTQVIMVDATSPKEDVAVFIATNLSQVLEPRIGTLANDYNLMPHSRV